MPSAHFEHTSAVTADPQSVWDHLQDPNTWAALAGVEEIYDVKRDESGNLAGYTFKARAGGQVYEGTSRVIEAVNPSLMILDINTSEVVGKITTTLNHDDSEVSINVGLDLSSRGFLASLFFPLITQAVGSGLPKQVEGFATRLGS